MAVPAILAGVAFAVLGDLLAQVWTFLPSWIDPAFTDAEWFSHDTGNEIQNLAGWALLAFLCQYLNERKLGVSYPVKLAICYLMQVMAVWSGLDLFDQIQNDNRRAIFGDLIGLAVAAGYGLASWLMWRTWMKSGQKVHGKLSCYLISKPPKSLLGVIPFLLRKKNRYLCNGKLWVKEKSGWQTPTIYRPKPDEILKYSGTAKELLNQITDGGN